MNKSAFYRDGMRKFAKIARFQYIQRSGRLREPGDPELDPETLGRLMTELKASKFYLEYGAGGSTLLVDSMSIPALSVESDRFYAELVKRKLGPNSKVELIVPKMGITRQWGRPVFRASAKGARYVGAPYSKCEQKFPDLALVDGRYRAACALMIALMAKRARRATRVIVDDYYKRAGYHEIERALGSPEKVGRSALFLVGDQTVDLELLKSLMVHSD